MLFRSRLSTVCMLSCLLAVAGGPCSLTAGHSPARHGVRSRPLGLRTFSPHGSALGLCTSVMVNSQEAPTWAGVSLRQPAAFNFDNTGSWPAWLTQFEDYAYAFGLCQAPPDVQVRTLLYCMGPEARVLLDTFGLNATYLNDYDTVVKRFLEHFVHPLNEVYESSRFHKRVQQPGESVDSYYAELCKLVKWCNYPSPDVEERLVRDRFVVGLCDGRPSDQLCRNAKLSLKDAWTQARQAEDAEKEKTARGSESGQLTVNVDTTKSHRGPTHQRKTMKRSDDTSAVPSRGDIDSGSCSYCG
ncbi:uncharacterized protein LOC115309590 [Ixodes scapularis]|uniref:uncharacterized protein LOC115309590 n=1 Tax=Ixodes scapularis TaxID=6945 RepID=UPI001AD73CDC|nr:uncharacterized protein LOC115309590 [Ixodes scapularis]